MFQRDQTDKNGSGDRHRLKIPQNLQAHSGFRRSFLAVGISAISRREVAAVCGHRDLKPDNIFLIDHSQHGAGRAAEGASGSDGAEGRSRREGQKDFVKIVDFGIAVAARGAAAVTVAAAVVKARKEADGSAAAPAAGPSADAAAAGQSTELPDLSARHTQDGVVLGTPHYMSPEQADDKEIDQGTAV